MPDTVAIQVDRELAASLERLARDQGRRLEELTEDAIRALIVLDGLERNIPAPPGMLSAAEQEAETLTAIASIASGQGLSEEDMDKVFDSLLAQDGARS